MLFDNKFNSKKVDPLVEAAKGAMKEGQLRREAIATVNEEFGVFNRNAVVRENLAKYDARIEEVFNGMKSGNLTEELSPKQKKMASLGGNPSKIDAPDLAKLRSGAKISEKKMWEGSGVSGEDPGMAVAKQAGAAQQSQTPSSTPARTGNAAGSTISNARSATGIKEEETIEEAVSRKHFQQVADLIKGHESQEKRNELASHHAGIFAKQNPRFDHGRFHAAAGSTAHEAPKKMEEAAYSAKAGRAGKNLGKKGPGTGFANLAKKAAKEYGSEESGKRVAGAILKKIRAKHMKEDENF